MKPDDAATPPCCVDEKQLIAYLDGELTGPAREQIAASLAECEACAAALADATLANEALGALPELRCPDHIPVAAEMAARVTPARPARRRLAAACVAVALAASLAAVALWPTDPTPRLTEAELHKLAEVNRQVGAKTAVAGIKAIDRGVVRPTRRVIATISEGPLGRWGDRATSFLKRREPPSADPT